MEYKRALLRGRLSTISILVAISYFVVDNLRHVNVNFPFYFAAFLLGIITLFLNRKRYYLLASLCLVVAYNLIIFVYCSSESYKSGSAVFFVCCCLASFAFFQNPRHAVLSCLFSIVLFVISFSGHPEIVPYRYFDDDYLRINFAYNFFGALITCVLIIYYLVDINRESEEKALEQNRLLMKTNEELDQFVYSASHDLRAPLSTIRGLVQLYEISTNDKEREELIGRIKDRAVKMDAFISDILDYSRNARSEVTLESVEILPLLREVADGLSHIRPSHTDSISIHAPAYETVMTDKRRLKVILTNLVSNALKYHRNGTELRVNISYWKDKTRWSVKVADNGTGIKAELLPRIFDMFYRASSQSEGSGLGLYIVKEALEKMKGEIKVESTYGEGSSFTVSFPL